MFGLKILDLILGLSFVYLILSLICSAINEYVAALTNRRGEMLFAGIRRLLDDPSDTKRTETTWQAFIEHPLINSLFGKRPEWHTADRKYPSYLPARTFAMALLDAVLVRHPNDLDEAAAPGAAAAGEPAAAVGGAAAVAAAPGVAAAGAGAQQAPRPTPHDVAPEALLKTLRVLRQDAAWEVVELPDDKALNLFRSHNVPAELKKRLGRLMSGADSDLQKLRDSVEVWYNNAMEHVTGEYKRRTQHWLLAISVVVAFLANADTLQIWRRLSADDALRTRLADRAAASLPAVSRYWAENQRALNADSSAGKRHDSAAATQTSVTAAPAGATATSDTTRRDSAAQDSSGQTKTGADPVRGAAAPVDTFAAAQALYDSATATLRDMDLQLGWDRREFERMGIIAETPRQSSFRQAVENAAKDSVAAENRRRGVHETNPPAADAPSINVLPPEYWTWGAVIGKVIGLFLTAAALSLGAPFWFDLVNKIVNVRAAGRAPDEKPRSPEGTPKRLAERTTR